MAKQTFGFQQFVCRAVIMLMLCQSCEATLVISIYNNNAVYLASDSLLTPRTHNKLKEINGPKIFMVSTNFCVCMSGLFGNPITTNTNQPSGLCTLSDKLKSYCDEEYSQAKPLGTKVRFICDNLQTALKAYLEKMKSDGVSLSPDDQTTMLYFAGYDCSQTNFVGFTYVFGTNVTSKVAFVRGVNNYEPPIYVFGEADFINTVTSSGEPRFKNIRSKIPDTYKAYIRAWEETPMPEEEMINLILQLFQLHKKYAASFYSDEGYIGEPYVIYKITKDGVKRVH